MPWSSCAVYTTGSVSPKNIINIRKAINAPAIMRRCSGFRLPNTLSIKNSTGISLHAAINIDMPTCISFAPISFNLMPINEW